MKLHPRLSRAAVDLVTRFEAFQGEARPTAEGGWTIGFAHTRSAREGAAVTRADAEALLLYDLDQAAGAVEAALYAPASQRQFEALTAFCFNIGAENFRRSSALAAFNAGAELEAADEIERWRRAELGAGAQVVDALVRRRAAEKAHFLGLPEGFSKTPGALVRPLPAGEPPPPPRGLGSATLDAANGIQARLRALVPEPPAADGAMEAVDAPPFPHPAAEPPPPEPSPEELLPQKPPEAAPPEAPAPGPQDVAAAPGRTGPPPYVAPPSPPPPPPASGAPPANDADAPDLAPSIPEATQPAEVPDGRPMTVRWRPRASARLFHALLAGLGACLLAVSAVLILGGRADLPGLGLGVAGALLLPLGAYGLLGPGRRRDGAPTA